MPDVYVTLVSASCHEAISSDVDTFNLLVPRARPEVVGC